MNYRSEIEHFMNKRYFFFRWDLRAFAIWTEAEILAQRNGLNEADILVKVLIPPCLHLQPMTSHPTMIFFLLLLLLVDKVCLNIILPLDNICLKKWAIPGLFFLFRLFNTEKLTVNVLNKIRQCPNSNHGPLVSEYTLLPTEPQPLQLDIIFAIGPYRTFILLEVFDSYLARLD